MFSLSALPLPSAAALPATMPAPLPATAMPAAGQSFGSPETLAETADTPPALTFDALLALQTATPQGIAPAATGPAIPASILQQTGKILPDPANPLAALLPQGTSPAAQGLAATAGNAGDDALASADTDDAVLPELVLPDAGLIAAIFTAPQRLAPAPDAPQEAARPALTTTFDPAASQLPVQQPLPEAPAPAAAMGAAAVVALAQTADIEQDQAPLPAQPLDKAGDSDAEAEQASRPAISTTATLAASTARTTRAAPPATNRADPAPEAPDRIALADAQDTPAQTDWAAPDITVPAFTPSANAAPESQPSAPVRHDARVEKIDFATLVENLSRAREEASPRTVNVAVTNTDFGRVSLRFDQDDKGLSVAMTSADPGFARAVSATAEAATANNANSQSANNGSDSQPKPQTGTNTQGDTPHQQSQQQAQQADRFAPGTPARASQTARAAADDAAPDDGIYA